MRNIKFSTNLSPDGIEKLIKDLKAEEKNFDILNSLFLDYSAEYLKEKAREYITATVTEYSTGNLLNSFEIEKSKGIIKVISNAKDPDTGVIYSAFVEFGTGEVGASNPHEQASEKGWQYNVNGHKNGWLFSLDGLPYFTRGQIAHRFMYNALNDFLYNGGKELCFKKAMNKIGG